MTDVGLTPPEEARVRQAADEAFRVLTREEDHLPLTEDRWIEGLRQATVEAPLRSLAVAFQIGVIARRR
jgi:hypothetical protein